MSKGGRGMKHAVSLGILASLCLVCTSAIPVSAEPPAPSPVGSWSFKTTRMNEGCVLSGAMTITRKADKTMACEFQAKWSCDQFVVRSVETEQTCTARQTGSTVTITSKMKKVGKVAPAELGDYMRANYAADHFKVKIDTTGDKMDGLFHSYGQASVAFRRHLELIG
jgi:hypothetical protein